MFFSGAGVQTDVIRFYQRHDTNFLWYYCLLVIIPLLYSILGSTINLFVVILSSSYYSFTISFWVEILIFLW